MIVGLSHSRDAHKAILGATESKSWHGVVEMGCTICVKLMMVAHEGRTHQNLALDLLVVLFSVLLGHNATKRVGCHENVLSGEASLVKVIKSGLNIVVNKDWLRSVK